MAVITEKSINLNYVTVVAIGENDHKIYFWFLSKSESADRMKNG